MFKSVKTTFVTIKKNAFCSTSLKNSLESLTIIETTNDEDLMSLHGILKADLKIYKDFVSASEERSLLAEIDRSFRRTKYEFGHWDGAIEGFRELEKSNWSSENQIIVDRINSMGHHGTNVIPRTHVLDLSKDGYIKPHIDSVKFCGSTITGLSLISPSVMRYKAERFPTALVDLLLPARSLYIMSNSLRYDFTHEILCEQQSYWRGQLVVRDRRVAVIARNNPS